jgi:hypothetical protein
MARWRISFQESGMGEFYPRKGRLSAGISLPPPETARAFALVIIGGLVTVTFLTLLPPPILDPTFEAEETEY